MSTNLTEYICKIPHFSNNYYDTEYVYFQHSLRLKNSWGTGSTIFFFAEDENQKQYNTSDFNISNYKNKTNVERSIPIKSVTCQIGFIMAYLKCCSTKELLSEFESLSAEMAQVFASKKDIFSSNCILLPKLQKAKRITTQNPAEILEEIHKANDFLTGYGQIIKKINSWITKNISSVKGGLVRYHKNIDVTVDDIVQKSNLFFSMPRVEKRTLEFISWSLANEQAFKECFIDLNEEKANSDSAFIVYCESATSDQNGFLNKDSRFGTLNEADLFYDEAKAKRSIAARGAADLDWSIWEIGLKVKKLKQQKSDHTPSGPISQIIARQEKADLEEFFKTQHYENLNKKLISYEQILKDNNLLPAASDTKAATKKHKI